MNTVLKCDRCGLEVRGNEVRKEWFAMPDGSFCSRKCAGLSEPKKRGGKRSRDKGNRRERQVVEWLRSIGCEAERIPLSGAAGGSFQHDIRATMPNGTLWHYEVKGRAQFKQLSDWLPKDAAGNPLSNGAVFLVPDRQCYMVVLSEWAFAALVRSTKP